MKTILRAAIFRFNSVYFYFEDASKKGKKVLMKNIKLLSMLSILTAMLFMNFACRQKIDEIYLIPRGFSGNIAVVFDVKQGEKVELENGSRVYRIPDDGILVTQASYNSTPHEEKFFFVEGDGERVPITRVIWGGEEEVRRLGISDDEVFVRYNGAAGGANRANYSRHYAGKSKGMAASEEDFGFSGAANLDARVESKAAKLRGGKISE